MTAIIVNPLNKFGNFCNEYFEKSGIDALVNGVGKAGELWQHANYGGCKAGRWEVMCC